MENGYIDEENRVSTGCVLRDFGRILNILVFHLRNNPEKYALFLGAGASRSSGYPLGDELVYHLLKELFHISEERFVEDRGELKEWFHEEYKSTAKLDCLIQEFIEVLGEASTKDLIERYFRSKTPSRGYQLLGELIGNGFFHCIFNMNFDHAIEDVLRMLNVDFRSVVTKEDVPYAFATYPDKPTIYKVHGDIDKPRTLRASIDQIEQLPDWLRNILENCLKGLPFIFIGYSAQDKDIFEVFQTVGKKDYKIFWVSPDSTPSKEVLSILKIFSSEKNYISIDFDEFFSILKRKILRRDIESLCNERDDCLPKKVLYVFVKPPKYTEAMDILERNNCLIITGPPHIGKTTLGEYFLYDHYMRGFNQVKLTVDDARSFNDLKNRIAASENSYFLLDDIFGTRILENVDVANRFDELLSRLSNSKVVVTSRQSVLDEVFEKTKIREMISNMDDYLFETRVFPEESLEKILSNHLEYYAVAPQEKEIILEHAEEICEKLTFPLNIDHFVKNLPELFTEKDLPMFVEKAKKIKEALYFEFDKMSKSHKIGLWTLSVTGSIELGLFKSIYLSLMEIYELQLISFDQLTRESEAWLIHEKDEKGRTYTRFYHFEYSEAIFDHLKGNSEDLVKIFHVLGRQKDPNILINLYLKGISEDLTANDKITEILSGMFRLCPIVTKIFAVDIMLGKYKELPESLRGLVKEAALTEGNLVRGTMTHSLLSDYEQLPDELKEMIPLLLKDPFVSAFVYSMTAETISSQAKDLILNALKPEALKEVEFTEKDIRELQELQADSLKVFGKSFKDAMLEDSDYFMNAVPEEIRNSLSKLVPSGLLEYVFSGGMAVLFSEDEPKVIFERLLEELSHPSEPASSMILFGMGQVYAKAGHFSYARHCYKQSLEYDSKNILASIELAEIDFIEEKYEDMKKDLIDCDYREDLRYILLNYMFRILAMEINGKDPLLLAKSLVGCVKSVPDDFGLFWSPREVIPLIERRIPESRQQRILDLIGLITGDVRIGDFESKYPELATDSTAPP